MIVLDEIDGMTASDRGGIGAAIQFIKRTRVPIICICNDRYHKKLRPLLKYCYEV